MKISINTSVIFRGSKRLKLAFVSISKYIVSRIRGYDLTFDDDINNMLDDDFMMLLKFGKRTSILFKTQIDGLIYLPYNLVKIEIIELIKKGKFTEVIKKIFEQKGVKLSDRKINRYDHNELLSFIFWIKDELESISNLESTYLSSEPEADLINAGINELNQFGDINLIDSLAQGDVLKWDDVLKLPYHQVFDKQHKTLIESRIQKKLNKIKSKKH